MMSSLAITPADTIELNLANGESAEASVSVVNSNDQKVLIKLRSNAGKLLRIKHSMFALDSKQKITLDIRIPSKFVDELIQKYTESGSLECYKLQFNVISISDLAFDKISKLPEEQQMEEMTNVWNVMSKSDIQQTFRTISFIHKSAHVGTVEERKSEESIDTLVSSDVYTTPEFRKLRKQYEALCVVFKRCEGIIKNQEKEKDELKKKLEESEKEVASLKDDINSHTCQVPVVSSMKPKLISAITVILVILAFVLGFVGGQLATQYGWK